MVKPNRHSPLDSAPSSVDIKKGLHPRNPHRARYDFTALIKSMPLLKSYVQTNSFGGISVDFSNPDAVKTLNKALLNYFYQIPIWDIPKGYLCPPIPGRVDYLHYLADLLADTHNGAIPKGKQIKGLDVGMGANCVYSILGHRVFGWQFVGADIDPISVNNATLLVSANSTLQGAIECRLQKNQNDIFTGMINSNERFDFTICNPPFHSSMDEATKGADRKLKNLAINSKKKRATMVNANTLNPKGKAKLTLNFGGQNAEL